MQFWVEAHPMSVPKEHGPGPVASWRHSLVAQLSHGAASRAQDGRTNPQELGLGARDGAAWQQRRAQQKIKKKKKKGEGGHRVTETSRLPLVPGSHRCGFPVPTAGTAALLFNNQTAQGFNRPVTISGQLSWVSQTPPGQRLLEAVSRRKRGAARQGGAWCRHPGDGGSPGERDAVPGTCPAPSCQPNPDTWLGSLLPWHSPQQQVPPAPTEPASPGQ